MYLILERQEIRDFFLDLADGHLWVLRDAGLLARRHGVLEREGAVDTCSRGCASGSSRTGAPG